MNNIIKRVWNQNRLVSIEDLTGMAFQAEDGGHTFQVSGVDDTGEAVALSGTVAGVFMRPDNADIALTGSASGGVVSVTLNEDCYTVPGRFGLTVFVTSGGQKVAVYACIGTVSRTSTGNVAGDTPQSVVDLINAINAAIASIPADYSALMAAIAPDYSSSSVYPKGAYAWYDGVLKKSTVAIPTAETFNPAHWTNAVITDDLGGDTSNKADVIVETASGAPVHIQDGAADPAVSAVADIRPTQDLHGYDHPWGPGGGVNLFDTDSAEYFTGLNGNANKWGHVFTTAGTYAIKAYGTTSTGTIRYIIKNSDNTWQGWTNINNPSVKTITSGQTLYVIDNAYHGSQDEQGRLDAIALFNTWKVQVALSSTQPDQYYPYSNVCPISGLSGLSVYVGPTQDPDDATEYSESFPAAVYGGSVDIVSGALVSRPYIASYAGETLVGPWVSSLDEYTPGGTPTAGAQVVDLGGTATPYQLTPQAVMMLYGESYLWSSTGDDVSVTYKADTKLYIDTKIAQAIAAALNA